MSGQGRKDMSIVRAREAVQADEALRGEHRVGLAARAPEPSYLRRPRGLRAERRTFWSWCMLPVGVTFGLVTMTWNPIEALADAVTWQGEKKPGKPFNGGWNSMAGSLARAVMPRTKNGADVIMQVTDRHLQLVYVSRAGTRTGRYGPVEVGWSAQLGNVRWIRDRSDVAGGCHEIGFVDGSWCSVQFIGQGWRHMAEAFPLRLSHLDCVPTGSGGAG